MIFPLFYVMLHAPWIIGHKEPFWWKLRARHLPFLEM